MSPLRDGAQPIADRILLALESMYATSPVVMLSSFFCAMFMKSYIFLHAAEPSAD